MIDEDGVLARRCAWCREVLIPDPSNGKLMVEVTHRPVTMRQRVVDYVCMICYGKLITLISQQRPTTSKANSDYQT